MARLIAHTSNVLGRIGLTSVLYQARAGDTSLQFLMHEGFISAPTSVLTSGAGVMLPVQPAQPSVGDCGPTASPRPLRAVMAVLESAAPAGPIDGMLRARYHSLTVAFDRVNRDFFRHATLSRSHMVPDACNP